MHHLSSRKTERDAAFERFDLYSLVQFQRHLCDGPKGDKTTLEATVDTSKYLKYACGPGITHHWERLTDRDQMLGYLEKPKWSRGTAGEIGRPIHGPLDL